MIDAELRGKLGADGSRAHDRAEDLLTSTVFGLLRYLPISEGLLPFLGRARPVQTGDLGSHVRTEPGWIDLEGVTQVELKFWPSFKEFGEPDVLIHLRNTDRVIHLVLIEAKLFSPKSSKAGEEDGELAVEDKPDPDQLVRYWQGLRRQQEVVAGASCSLIYLTSHGTPPLAELRDSVCRASGMRLAWLSWRDAWFVAHQLALSTRSPPAEDMVRLLAHKGFREFVGFDESLIPMLRFPASFWQPSGFFRMSPPEELASFWKQAPRFWSDP
jgi:hypothetical protein